MRNETAKQAKKNSLWVNLLLILIVVALAATPLFLVGDAEFEGADALAEETAIEIMPDYKPWFLPIFEPKSGEIESLLFALQAALGAGVIGYGFGYLKGNKRKRDEQAA